MINQEEEDMKRVASVYGIGEVARLLSVFSLFRVSYGL